MARLCPACRQPLDGDPRLHDCPDDEPRDDGEGGPEAA